MDRTAPHTPALDRLPAFDPGSGLVNTVLETPKGCSGKLKYEPGQGIFTLSYLLPPGQVFPHNFGFIPGTEGQDGDPLDLLLVLDTPLPTGLLVKTRLLGVIMAEQTDHRGKTVRNDRLLGVPDQAREPVADDPVPVLSRQLLEDVEAFFIDYNRRRGRHFRPVGVGDADEAHAILTAALVKA
ncbi:inorganic diphosphatase [Nitrospirillum sp. BR 11163]|uniref:inorganic diphosphatase n=1 Tax=Nitrospirillum sp. BR 11163 TaxID=3104323 RepID=UPI002AFE7369|nr:inorganic diphosphatase [Nitrospirillum sp. BR 11163]MEA1671806.1 inorganic diphosphatase [Nitrospirillum sp. BR 11163]